MTPDRLRDLFLAGHLDGWLEVEKELNTLKSDLDNSRKATESVQAAAEIERSEWRAKLMQAGNDLAAEIGGHLSTKQALRRLAAEQVQTLRALRELLESLRGFAIGFPTEAPADRHCRAWRQAEEVLKLLEVPFG